jgi:hypothetical protein
LTLVQEENRGQAMLLQEYEQTIDILKDELEGERERRLQLENAIGNKM